MANGNGFTKMSPYTDSFMNIEDDWRTKHEMHNQTYVPMDTQATAMKTNNMKLGDPTNLTDTRSNPLVTTQQALTSSTNTSNQSLAGSSTLANPVQDEKPWYGSLPQGQSDYDPLVDRPKLLGRSRTEEDVDRMKDISGAQDTYERERRSISGPNSMYKSRVQSTGGAFGAPVTPNPVETGELSATMGGADNLANYGVEEFDLSKPPPPPGFLSDEKMSSILEAPIPEATEILDVASATEGDYKAPTSTDPLRRLRGLWAEEQAGELVGETAEKAGKSLGDSLGTAMAFAPLVTGAINFAQNRGVIGDLKEAKTSAEGARGDLANQRGAEVDAIRDQLSEDRRRAGELEKSELKGDLRKIAQYKGGGLSSGSAVEAAEDVLDQGHSRTDMTLAGLYEKSAEAEDTVIDQNRSARQKLTEQIDTLDAKLDEMNKQQITGPIKSIVDVGSNLLMASNPALAIGMKVGSSLLA